MKHFILSVAILLFAAGNLFSQQNNEIIFDTDFSIGCNRIIEDNMGDYVLNCGFGDTTNHISSKIVKLTPDFDTTSVTISFPGHDISFGDFVVTENNDYIFFGYYGIDTGYQSYYYTNFVIMCLDENLDEKYMKYYQLPESHKNPNMKVSLTENGDLYAAGTLRYSTDTTYGKDVLYLVKFDENGDTLKTSITEDQYGSIQVHDILPKNNGEEGLYVIGNGFLNLYGKEVFDVGPDLGYSVIGLDQSAYGLGSRASAKWINDSVYMFVSFSTPPESKNKESKIYTEDLFITKVTDDHELIGEPVWVGRHDTTDYLAMYGFDFTDPSMMFAGAFNMQSPTTSYQNYYFVSLFDEDMNIKGVKSIGEPDQNYMLLTICATDDGGCLFSAITYDYVNDPDYDFDLHILKLYPNDIITSASETPLVIDSDYSVFPNPGKDVLYVRTARKGSTIKMYNENGGLALEGKLGTGNTTEINTAALNPGIYLFEFTDKSGNTETGKWIKK